MGRPTKLTLEVQVTIVQAIHGRSPRETAARYAGIDRSTFYRWLERGDPDGEAEADAPFRDFRDAVERALVETEVKAVAQIAKAAESRWQAAAWYLERVVNPAVYGRKRVEITGPDGEPVAVRVQGFTNEELDAAKQRLAEVAARHEGRDDPGTPSGG